jgi:hypothetical protein
MDRDCDQDPKAQVHEQGPVYNPLFDCEAYRAWCDGRMNAQDRGARASLIPENFSAFEF